MNQQVFADFLGINPATLSGILNDRTKPTLNIVEAVRKKFPDISLDWLMFGTGTMINQQASSVDDQNSVPSSSTNGSLSNQSQIFGQESMLDFRGSSSPLPSVAPLPGTQHNGVRMTHPEIVREEVKYIDKPMRRVTEIRVYYDDQTWESFVPAKK